MKLLKRAFELAPDDPLTQEMLAEVLLEALATDYAAFRDDVPLVGELIRDREQQIELMRIEAGGLDKLGQRLAAFDALPAAGRFHRRRSPRTANRRRIQRAERSLDLRPARHAVVEAPRRGARGDCRAGSRRGVPQLENPRTAAELRHYLAHVDQLPGADERAHASGAIPDRSQAHAGSGNRAAGIELPRPASETRAAAAELMARLACRQSTAGMIVVPHAESVAARAGGRRVIPTAARIADVRHACAGRTAAGYRQLRIEQDFCPARRRLNGTSRWIARSWSAAIRLGDDVFHLAVDQNNWARQYRDSSLVHAARLGQLAVRRAGRPDHGDRFAARWAGRRRRSCCGRPIRYRRYSSRYRCSGHGAVTSAGSGASRRPVYHAWSGRKRMTGAVGVGVCSLGPVTPRGVVFQEQDRLKCVDPLSGEVLWMRTDIPAGCELFGDKEFVFAADVSGRVAHVIRMVDGRLVGKRELPKHEWLLTAGRNVAELGFEMNRESRVLLLRVTDVWSQDVLYEAEFPITSRSRSSNRTRSRCTSRGRFQLIDVRTGRATIDEQLRGRARRAMHSHDAVRRRTFSARQQPAAPTIQAARAAARLSADQRPRVLHSA